MAVYERYIVENPSAEQMVKALRNCAFGDCADCAYLKYEDCDGLVLAAARVIERLNTELEYTKRQYELAIDDMEKTWSDDSSLIPTTEKEI